MGSLGFGAWGALAASHGLLSTTEPSEHGSAGQAGTRDQEPLVSASEAAVFLLSSHPWLPGLISQLLLCTTKQTATVIINTLRAAIRLGKVIQNIRSELEKEKKKTIHGSSLPHPPAICQHSSTPKHAFWRQSSVSQKSLWLSPARGTWVSLQWRGLACLLACVCYPPLPQEPLGVCWRSTRGEG